MNTQMNTRIIPLNDMINAEGTQEQTSTTKSEQQSKLESLVQDHVINAGIEITSAGKEIVSSLLSADTNVNNLINTLSPSEGYKDTTTTHSSAQKNNVLSTTDHMNTTPSSTASSIREAGSIVGNVLGLAVGIFNIVKTVQEMKETLAKMDNLKEERELASQEETKQSADANLLDKEEVKEGPSLDRQIRGLWLTFGSKVLKMVAALAQIIAALANIIKAIINLVNTNNA